MQQHAKALTFAVVGTVGTVAAVLLTLSMVQFAARKAEATPAIAQGKACNTCHTSSRPSKSDLKK
jgi:cytochrome c551/c552